jgi:hypothetical protein
MTRFRDPSPPVGARRLGTACGRTAIRAAIRGRDHRDLRTQVANRSTHEARRRPRQDQDHEQGQTGAAPVAGGVPPAVGERDDAAMRQAKVKK